MAIEALVKLLHSSSFLSVRWWWEVSFLLLSMVLLISVPACARAEPAFLFGVGTHLSPGKRDIVRSLDLLKILGVKAIRDDATWAQVEREEGVLIIPENWDFMVDEAAKRGISVLWILCYANDLYEKGGVTNEESRLAFARYAAFVVSHFKGRVEYYELWNEWELTTGGTDSGDAADYVRLANETIPLLKNLDSEIKVLVGAVGTDGIKGGFLRDIVEGGILDYTNNLSIHPYVHCDDKARSPRLWAAWVDEIRSNLTEWSEKSVNIYITEIGWPSSKGACGINEYTQAVYLGEMLDHVGEMSFVKGVWWYDFQNDGGDRYNMEHNFGLVDELYIPKPAFNALKGRTK